MEGAHAPGYPLGYAGRVMVVTTAATNVEARKVQRTYLLLTLLSTLSASFIWGINTLFLLDAGLNNAEAFAANAFFTAGMVVFEVPTGALADTWGRRASYLLGAATLLVSTLLTLVVIPAVYSMIERLKDRLLGRSEPAAETAAEPARDAGDDLMPDAAGPAVPVG